MTEVLYICLWYKDKKRTWSGTAWSLRQAMEPYLQVQDLALSDPLYRKILRRLQRKKGLNPGPVLRDRLRLSREICYVETSAQDRRKNACVSVWRLAVGERIWHPISIRTFPFPRFCGCRGKIRWAIGTASMIRCRKDAGTQGGETIGAIPAK